MKWSWPVLADFLTCLEGLKKTMKNLSGRPLRDSNWVLSKYTYSSTLSLTSALDWGLRSQRLGLVTLFPGKNPGTHCTGGWVGPRFGVEG
jgi:hypothetical protein